MEKIMNKLFWLLSSGMLFVAIHSVNMISRSHLHQEKEPGSLKKYEKI